METIYLRFVKENPGITQYKIALEKRLDKSLVTKYITSLENKKFIIKNNKYNHKFHIHKNNVHKIYHDTQYGYALDSDNELFGRLILEINQAGLSWNTILNKQDNFRKAYSNFSIKTIANYNDKARTRLLNDAGIIRNRLKINAVIYNAQIIIQIQKKFTNKENVTDEK